MVNCYRGGSRYFSQVDFISGRLASIVLTAQLQVINNLVRRMDIVVYSCIACNPPTIHHMVQTPILRIFGVNEWVGDELEPVPIRTPIDP